MKVSKLKPGDVVVPTHDDTMVVRHIDDLAEFGNFMRKGEPYIVAAVKIKDPSSRCMFDCCFTYIAPTGEVVQSGHVQDGTLEDWGFKLL